MSNLTELSKLRATFNQTQLGRLIAMATEAMDLARAFADLLKGPPLPAGLENDPDLVVLYDEFVKAAERFRDCHNRTDDPTKAAFKEWDEAHNGNPLDEVTDELIERRWADCPALLARLAQPEPAAEPLPDLMALLPEAEPEPIVEATEPIVTAPPDPVHIACEPKPAPKPVTEEREFRFSVDTMFSRKRCRRHGTDDRSAR